MQAASGTKTHGERRHKGRTWVGCNKAALGSCAPRTRTLTVLSSDAVASMRPSWLKFTQRTVPVCALRTVERPSLHARPALMMMCEQTSVPKPGSGVGGASGSAVSKSCAAIGEAHSHCRLPEAYSAVFGPRCYQRMRWGEGHGVHAGLQKPARGSQGWSRIGVHALTTLPGMLQHSVSYGTAHP